jgi:hypothetical protein
MAAKKIPGMKIISERTWDAEQSWWLERIWENPDGRRMKVVARHNAYAFQSYVRVSIWSGSKWETVYSLMGEEFNRISYVEKGPMDPKRFDPSVRDAVATAMKIVG